jgi:purine-binding chemotaxis protein CheW
LSAPSVIARIGDTTLAFALAEVREVLLDVDVRPVPLAPPVIAGLVNLRGEVLTAVDGPLLLGLRPAPPPGGPAQVVLRGPGAGRSLIVDEVLAVRPIDDAPTQAPPPNLNPALVEVASSLVLLGDQLTVRVDGRALIARLLAAVSPPATAAGGPHPTTAQDAALERR